MLKGPIVLVLMIAAQSQEPANPERARHQGIWVATSSIRDGEPAPAEVVASIRRVVEGDHVVWKRDGKNFAGTRFEIDPTKTPRTIDLIPDGGPNRDKRVLGIYKLDGDDLTICIADLDRPRPSSFEAKPRSKQTLQTFKRVKPR
jgi:uncharacterized protein (TIGR03067 family)